MKERPILFSGAMVRALLAGTKTQTRRLMKPQPDTSTPGYWAWSPRRGVSVGKPSAFVYGPFGMPGDRLWVRESFAENYFGDDGPSRHGYMADWDGAAADVVPRPRWTPSIHMPRRCSRITLDVTDVRVERVQDITEAGARAEGLPLPGEQPATINGKRGSVCFFEARPAFAYLWDALNGKTAPWKSNPWIWVVSFNRVGWGQAGTGAG